MHDEDEPTGLVEKLLATVESVEERVHEAVDKYAIITPPPTGFERWLAVAVPVAAARVGYATDADGVGARQRVVEEALLLAAALEDAFHEVASGRRVV